MKRFVVTAIRNIRVRNDGEDALLQLHGENEALEVVIDFDTLFTLTSNLKDLLYQAVLNDYAPDPRLIADEYQEQIPVIDVDEMAGSPTPDGGIALRLYDRRGGSIQAMLGAEAVQALKAVLAVDSHLEMPRN